MELGPQNKLDMLTAEGQRMMRVPLKISVSWMAVVSRSGAFAKDYGNWRVNAQDFVAEYIVEYMQIGGNPRGRAFRR